jgi:uncharacterized protein (DUF1015 family)
MTTATPVSRRLVYPLVNTAKAHMVTAEWAPVVVSPLHDVLSDAERRAILADNPHSYLHVTSDPLALPEPPGDAATESLQARALRRLLDVGAYTAMPQPALFVYRLTLGGREHTGVIASVALAGFGDGRVLGHEAVQHERVAGLVRHYQHVPMRSELVALFHHVDPVVAELTARVVAGRPLLVFTDAGGVAQSVWRAGSAEAAALTRRLSAKRLYIADGHHRVAAATRCWETAGRPGTGSVLCVLYPQDAIALHAFHRRLRGPVDVPALLKDLETSFAVTSTDVPRGHGPGVARGTLGLYAAGSWRVLRPREPASRAGVAGLDVTMLHEQVLGPLLGIDHRNPRLQFVPDVRGVGASTRECDADAGVLFTLHAPSIDDLVSVAERREVMSTKTTYVQPKPHTGIFLS